ncbi:MAG: hydroxymethylglutaryl-CoA synthase [Candidatus Micrarchaeia archaeon]
MLKGIGIIGYGAYVPRLRIKVEEIARVWGEDPEAIKGGLNIREKSVPGIGEDTATIATEAARNAVVHAGIDPVHIEAVFVGSESHPYAVKPTATIVAEAIEATPKLMAADMEFACKAGTAAIQCCMGLVASGMVKFGLAIGADTSQGRPGDALEYTASAGGAAYIIGRDTDSPIIAEIKDTYSFTTDTPDFWRRPGEEYPSHGGRFTGQPAYFKHVIEATKGLLEKTGMKIDDFDYVVFHQPNGKFPLQAAAALGIDKKKLEPGLLTPLIGNTYSGASPLGLAAVLDIAKPGQRILVTSYGSGAGSDSFLIDVTPAIEDKRERIRPVRSYIDQKEYIDYGVYVKHRKKLKL